MDNVDQNLVNKLIKLGLKPIKRALVYDDFVIINSFYLESEELFLKQMGRMAFDPMLPYEKRKKILLLLVKFIN